MRGFAASIRRGRVAGAGSTRVAPGLLTCVVSIVTRRDGVHSHAISSMETLLHEASAQLDPADLAAPLRGTVAAA